MKDLFRTLVHYCRRLVNSRVFWLSLTLGITGFVFFYNMIEAWDLAFPFCSADDWRTIHIYLEKFYAGDLTFLDYWKDPAHPAAIYTLTLLTNAHYFALRPDYFVRIFLLFQLAIGILVALRMYKMSVGFSFSGKLLTFLGSISCCMVLFNLQNLTHYSWDRVTQGYLYICVFVLTILVLERILTDTASWIETFVILTLFTVFACAYIELMMLFAVTIASVLIWNAIRRKTPAGLTIFTACFLLLVSYILLLLIFNLALYRPGREFMWTTHFGSSFDWGKLGAMLMRPWLAIQAFGIGLLSSIINTTHMLRQWPQLHPVIVYGSMLFAISYVILLGCNLFGKDPHKCLFQTILMVFCLVYMVPVLIFRVSPITHAQGVFCLVTPRYMIFYHIGLIGYLFSLIHWLLPMLKKYRLRVIGFATVIAFALTLIWITDALIIDKKAAFNKAHYPKIAEQMRLKANDPTIAMPAWVAPPRLGDLNYELGLLQKHELNVFAETFPY